MLRDGISRESTRMDKIFVPKLDMLKESNEEQILNFPINQEMKYDQTKMVQAIRYGMIILIQYKGDKDETPTGHERVIYPMVIGVNKNTGNVLIRGWHVDGYSVKMGQHVERVWRLFKADNIISMLFTGNFFRLSPAGYKMNDRVMTERTIQRADFNQIRRNQNQLIQAGKIQSEEEKTLHKTGAVPKIIIQATNTVVSLLQPWRNDVLKDLSKNAANLKISVLKSVIGNNFIMVYDALGTIGRTVHVYLDDNTDMKEYKTVAGFLGTDFKKYTNGILNKRDFNLYKFVKIK